MRIAVFTDFHPDSLGGIQTSITAQVNAFRRLGHRVCVFTAPLGRRDEPDSDTVVLPELRAASRVAHIASKVDQYRFVAPSNRNIETTTRELTRRGPFDIAHIHSSFGVAVIGIRAARACGVPVVQTMHSRDDAFFEQTSPFPLVGPVLLGLALRRYLEYPPRVTVAGDSRSAAVSWHSMAAQAHAADHVVAPTEHFARRLRAHGVTRPLTVVSNGVDDALVDAARAASESPPGIGLRAVYLGRLSAEKRVREAVDAVTRVPGVTLDLYGDGDLQPALERLAAERGRADDVRCHGRVPHLDALCALAAADIALVNSFDFDTQCVVLLEATAVGTPVVYCDPDLAESLAPGGGVCTADSSTGALAHELRRLAADRRAVTAMSDAQRAAWDAPRQSRVTERLLDVYRSL
ncbi:glycosyltransferase [Tsukamurella sp. 8F]|uniref:glycosyltransferase n=1 Tax=unclassified Tsukamurella TaxID=2633480 RepID=UPI0023B97E8E|nr:MULTISPECIES: glycosyltransferase [unclassified Tsukamurella]MDF0530800.1 glycosyltransferase [Tsukamurella sp. 8J]MDF0588326.1 glycosyltransferase [Tsukamurella sp. 8F]